MTYAGFDRDDCPSLDLMARLRAETNLVWTGFYLPAPSNRGSTWRGQRAALRAQGWGLCPTFVGQQVTGAGSHNVSSTQGGADAQRACEAMRAEGFAPGSRVFLDVENGLPFGYAQRAYIAAWIDGVAAGGFVPGVYCSFEAAPIVAVMRPAAKLWVFRVRTTAPHAVDGTQFIAPEPALSGFAGASLWQHDDSALLTRFGGLLVDLDVADTPDPSAPDATAQAPVAVTTAPADPVREAALAMRDAVMAFQRAAGLVVDGDPGPITGGAYARALT